MLTTTNLRLRPVDYGIAVFAALQLCISVSIALVYGQTETFNVSIFTKSLWQVFTIFFTVFLFLTLLKSIITAATTKYTNRERAILNDLKAGPLNLSRLKQNFVIFSSMIVVFSTFSIMKIIIPNIIPFSWDVTLKNLDLILHFNHDPWVLIQPIFGHVYVTKAISFLYNLWLGIVFTFIYWQLFYARNEVIRMRYLYSVVMIWGILGTFFALVFSSAGPCYHELITGSDHYGALMKYLYSANETTEIFALTAQNLLWENYSNKSNISGTGISAFPSVHVSMALSFVLLSKHINRKCFIGFLLFLVIIMIGSVHLGWHYAVDGYAAMILTLIVWWISGRIVQRLHTQDT